MCDRFDVTTEVVKDRLPAKALLCLRERRFSIEGLSNSDADVSFEKLHPNNLVPQATIVHAAFDKLVWFDLRRLCADLKARNGNH